MVFGIASDQVLFESSLYVFPLDVWEPRPLLQTFSVAGSRPAKWRLARIGLLGRRIRNICCIIFLTSKTAKHPSSPQPGPTFWCQRRQKLPQWIAPKMGWSCSLRCLPRLLSWDVAVTDSRPCAESFQARDVALHGDLSGSIRFCRFQIVDSSSFCHAWM